MARPGCRAAVCPGRVRTGAEVDGARGWQAPPRLQDKRVRPKEPTRCVSIEVIAAASRRSAPSGATNNLSERPRRFNWVFHLLRIARTRVIHRLSTRRSVGGPRRPPVKAVQTPRPCRSRDDTRPGRASRWRRGRMRKRTSGARAGLELKPGLDLRSHCLHPGPLRHRSDDGVGQHAERSRSDPEDGRVRSGGRPDPLELG